MLSKRVLLLRRSQERYIRSGNWIHVAASGVPHVTCRHQRQRSTHMRKRQIENRNSYRVRVLINLDNYYSNYRAHQSLVQRHAREKRQDNTDDVVRIKCSRYVFFVVIQNESNATKLIQSRYINVLSLCSGVPAKINLC